MMLNELYDKIKEQSRFDDIFKPVSKKEIKKRLRSRLEHSKFEYLFAADVKGKVSCRGYLVDMTADVLANAFMDIVNSSSGPIEPGLTMGDEDKADLKITIPKITKKGSNFVEGYFSGKLVFLNFEGPIEGQTDEQFAIDLLNCRLEWSNQNADPEEYRDSGGFFGVIGIMKVSDVKVSNVIKMSKEEEEEEEPEERTINRALERGKCTLNPDGTYSCEGDVDLHGMNLTKIPVRFKEVKGNFDCSYNRLETLEGCPRIVEGYFHCGNDNLETLKGAPKRVGGNFSCVANNLETLEGSPEEVGESVFCSYNNLETLEGCPKKVGKSIYCFDNKLTTLRGVPEKLRGSIFFEGNPIAEELGIDRIKGSELHKYVK